MKKNIYKHEKLSVKILSLCINIIKYVLLYLVILIFLLIISIILIKIYKYTTTTNLFKLNTVFIKGNNYLSKQDILKFCNIKNGMNIFDINLIEIKNRLLENKWIEDVSIKRIIPDKIEIYIKEKSPIFISIIQGRLYYIDKYGEKISIVNKEKVLSKPILETKNYNYINYINKLYYLLRSKDIPISLNTIGWVSIGYFYIKFFDYKNKIFWIIDKDLFDESINTIRIIFRKLSKYNNVSNIHRITVIGNMCWVKYKQ